MTQKAFPEQPDEDDVCDLDPEKICDNCMKCVIGDRDFAAIQISGIKLEHEHDEDQPS